MKKKFLSALLLAAFSFAATSTFVSCKDYEDDINANTTRIENLEKALNTQIQTLTSDLNSVRKTAEEALANAATAQARGDQAYALAEQARAAAATAQAKADENAIELARQLILINGKVDQAEFDEKMGELNAKIAAIDTKLLELTSADELLNEKTIANAAAIEDIKGQIEVLETFKQSVQEYNIPEIKTKIEQAISDLNEIKAGIATNTEVQELKEKMSEAKKAITKLNEDLNTKIAELSTELSKTIDTKVDAVKTDINTLNIYVDQTITSLVYAPKEWVLSFGAIPVYSITANTYQITVPTTLTTTGETVTPSNEVYAISPAALAQYYMNPTTANIDNYTFKFVDLETTDRFAVASTRAHNDAESVEPTIDSISVKGGILSVKFNIKSENINDAVIKDGKAWVSTLALQATHKNLEDEDATVTSDFAVLSPTYLKDLALANNEYALDSCDQKSGVKDYHLVLAAADAINAFTTKTDSVSFTVDYKDTEGTLDLNKKIEIHYTQSLTEDGEQSAEKLMTVEEAKELGLDVVYTQVGYTLDESNPVDETAAAHLTIEDGIVKAAGEDKKEAIGHMALVRVEVKDGEKSIAVGYVSILVVPAGLYFVEETYAEGLALDCPANKDAKADSAKVVLYNKLIKDLVEKTGVSEDIAKQYTLESEKRYAAYDKDQLQENPLGDVTVTTDENGQLLWIFNEKQIRDAFYPEGKYVAPTADLTTIVRLISPDEVKYPNVWVKLIIPKDKIAHAQATISLEENGIKQMWHAYETVKGGTGYKEIHANVAQPGNAGATSDEEFKNNLLATFVGNEAEGVVSNADKFPNFQNSPLTIVFDVAKYPMTFNGTSGTTYKLTADQTTVYAEAEGVEKTAVVVLSDDEQGGRIAEYQNNYVAKDLLNTYSHKENDNTTKAFYTYMTLIDEVNCFPLDLSGDKDFLVRYLRPVDVVSNKSATFIDASVEGYSELEIAKMFNFSDWRDLGFGQNVHEDWFSFYGIKSIAPNMDEATTNINGVDGQKLKDITSLISLTYIEGEGEAPFENYNAFVKAMGKIRYENNGFTTNEFNLVIPFTVEHNWGKIENVMVTVPVEKSLNNAKQH